MFDLLQVSPVDFGVAHLRESLWSRSDFELADFNDCSEAVSTVQSIDGLVHILETLDLVCNKSIDIQLVSHNSLNQLWDFSPALPSTKSSTLPNSSCDELEWSCRDLMS